MATRKELEALIEGFEEGTVDPEEIIDLLRESEVTPRDDFAQMKSDARSKIGAAREEGRAEGRTQAGAKRSKAKEAMKAGRKIKFGGKAAMAGRLGSKLLVGGGTLGTGLVLLDLLGMLRSASEDDTRSTLRRQSLGNYERSMGAMVGDNLEDRLERSRALRRTATRNMAPSGPGLSPELRALLSEQQMAGLARARQRSLPTAQEAYAKYGVM